MALNVETHFVLPLIAFYDKEPTDQVREHVNARLDGVSVRDLENAVEWLKNNRRTLSSFPSPKDCIKAVEEGQKGRGKPIVSEARGITAETYAEASAAFVATKKRCAMIEPYTEEWAAWKAYFTARNMVAQLKWMAEVLGDHNDYERFSVPSRWPWDFDKEAERAIPPAEERPPPPVYVTEEQRERITKEVLQRFRASKLQQPETREAAE